MDYRQAVRAAAEKHGLDPNLAEATMFQESAGNPNAVSPKGAQGLMQLMPATAKELGVDPRDPLQNIDGGVRYLKQQVDKFGVPGGLAAYNAGAGRLQRVGMDYNKLPQETRDYVPKIMERTVTIAERNGTLRQDSNVPNGVPAEQTQELRSAAPAGANLPNDPNVLLSGLQKAQAAGDTEAVALISSHLNTKLTTATQRAQEAGDTEAVEYFQSLAKQVGGSSPSPAPQNTATEAPKAPEDPFESRVAALRKEQDAAKGTEAEKPAFDWSQNARTIYRDKNGKDFKGDDAAAAKWLKQEMSDLNNNIALGGHQAFKAKDYSPAGKKALLDSMEAYDNTSIGDVWKEVGQSVLTDPTTYLGLGIGKVATKAGQLTAKEAIKRGLRESLEKGVGERMKGKAINAVTGRVALGAAEAGAAVAATDAIKQTAEVNADGKEEIDLSQTAKQGAMGVAGGAVVGKVLNRFTSGRAIEKLAQKSNGTEEGVKMQAEIIIDLADRAKNRNFLGKNLQSKQLNQVTNAEIKAADDAILASKNNLAKEGVDVKGLRNTLQNWASRSEREIEALRGTEAGNAVADVITKAQLRAAHTAEQDAAGGIKKIARGVNDVAFQPNASRLAIKSVLGGQKSRKLTTKELTSGKNIKASNRILAELGQSQAATAQTTLAGLVKDSVAKQAARGVTSGGRRGKFDGMSDYDIVQQALDKRQTKEYDAAIKEVDEGYSAVQKEKNRLLAKEAVEQQAIRDLKAKEKLKALENNPDAVVPSVRNPMDIEAESSLLRNDIINRSKEEAQKAADFKLVEGVIQKQATRKALAEQGESEAVKLARMTPEQRQKIASEKALATEISKDPSLLVPGARSTKEAPALRKAWEDALKDRYGSAVDPKADAKAAKAEANAIKSAMADEERLAKEAARIERQAEEARRKALKAQVKKAEGEAAKNTPDKIQARADKAQRSKDTLRRVRAEADLAELNLAKAKSGEGVLSAASAPAKVETPAQATVKVETPAQASKGALSEETATGMTKGQEVGRAKAMTVAQLKAAGGGSLRTTATVFAGRAGLDEAGTISALQRYAKQNPAATDDVNILLSNSPLGTKETKEMLVLQDAVLTMLAEEGVPIKPISAVRESAREASRTAAINQAMGQLDTAKKAAGDDLQLAALAEKIARIKPKAEKQSAYEEALASIKYADKHDFLETYIEPLTKYGK